MLDNGGNVAPLAPTIAYAIEDHGRVLAVAWLPAPIPTTVAQALRRLPARSHADEQAFARNECCCTFYAGRGTDFEVTPIRPTIAVQDQIWSRPRC